MRGRAAHRGVTFVLSALMILVGLAAIVRTATAGGAGLAVGYLLGLGLVTAGALRLYVLTRTG